jgi:hypothetical protein
MPVNRGVAMEALESVPGPDPIPGAQDHVNAARRLWFFLFPLGGLASCAALVATRSFWGVAFGGALFLACVAIVARKARPEWSGRRLLGLAAAVLAFFPVPYLAMALSLAAPHVTWLLASELLWLLPLSVAGYVLTLPLALSGIARRFGMGGGSPMAALAVYCPALWLTVSRQTATVVAAVAGLFVAFGLPFLPAREANRSEPRRRFSPLGVLEVAGFLSAIGFAAVLCLYVWRWAGASWRLVVPLLIPLIWLPAIMPVRGSVVEPDAAA